MLSGVVDTPVDRILRVRHVSRLADLAADYADQSAAAALDGNPRRAFYFDFWTHRTLDLADRAAAEPLLRALGALT